MARSVTPMEAAEEKVITGWPTQDGVMVLTSTGNLFERRLDPRNFDPINKVKHVWVKVVGPLDE